MFHRLYLDTNVLHNNWPSLSIGVRILFLKARQLNVELSIPVPVERELRRQMEERITKALERLETADQELADVISSFDDDFATAPSIISVRQSMTKYDDACEKAKHEWGIRSPLFSSEPIEHFFLLAIERFPPFKNVGKSNEVAGFQDAVILWSIYNDLQRSPEFPCAFLTQDRGFHHESIIRTLSNLGLSLVLYQRIEDVLEALNRNMSDHLRAILNEQESFAHEAVLKNQEEIERSIAGSLTKDQVETLVGTDRDVQRCLGFTLEKIEGQIVEPSTGAEQTFGASFTISGELCYEALLLKWRYIDRTRVWLEVEAKIARSSHDTPSATFIAVRPSFAYGEKVME